MGGATLQPLRAELLDLTVARRRLQGTVKGEASDAKQHEKPGPEAESDRAAEAGSRGLTHDGSLTFEA